MPYEYRKLSPKEREKLVRYRSDRGYPLHAPPHPFREAGVYMISVANFEHRAIMNSPKRRTEFEIRLLNAIKEITDELIAWVVLPNHYHVLLKVQSLDDLSATLKHLHLHIAFNYIHYNPVKHGYVSDPYHWPRSSLAIYYADKGKGWLQDHWLAYVPPVDFDKGWDDSVEND